MNMIHLGLIFLFLNEMQFFMYRCGWANSFFHFFPYFSLFLDSVFQAKIAKTLKSVCEVGCLRKHRFFFFLFFLFFFFFFLLQEKI